ncbi:MAG: class I SAM-dependent methyltransferase [Anaerolineae bacterium]|nr:class I SAM-dependent methyltransferase [Anaerolineae bacterium]MDW8101831.1 class I SAM-dependent methyltransferase [Anaerolineae bacterium]
MEEVLEKLLLSAPPDNALWKAWEYLAFREEELTPPVLDLGCGDGKFACTLFPNSIDFGIDINRGRLKKALKAGAYRATLQANACGLPFQDQSFGTVFSACVLEHIPRVELVIEEVGRILKPGGKFIFSVPSQHFESYVLAPEARTSPSLSFFRRSLAGVINGLLKMRHFYTPSHWGTMLHRAGMKLVRFRYILPPRATAFWAHSFFWGNAIFPFLFLLYRTPLKGAILGSFTAILLPFLRGPVRKGGGLILVAEKLG